VVRDVSRSADAGFTLVELLVAATLGILVSGAALGLCAVGNRAVARLVRAQDAWEATRAAEALWATEWRGAGFDPTGLAGAGMGPLGPETLAIQGDWNGDGALLPTATNPEERVEHVVGVGIWRRGVNAGPRLPAAWPDSGRFAYRDATGNPLPPRPEARLARRVELQAWVPTGGPAGGALEFRWSVARRNPAVP